MKSRIKLLVLVLLVGLIGSAVVAPKIASAFGPGDGLSAGTAFQIQNCQDLQDMATDLDAFYILANDIDCSATSTWNGGAGFAPVGAQSNRFIGQLDGNDHTISGFVINSTSTDDKGIFGWLGAPSVVKDLTMTNVSIEGRYNVGTIAGTTFGSITGVSTSGTASGVGTAGGIVGGIYEGGSLTNSDSSVDVDGQTGDRMGGIVGWCEPCTLTNVSASGDVTGGLYVGGVGGYIIGSTISGADAHGNVSGTKQHVGGAFGYAGNSSSITLSYATGDVTGTDDYWYASTGGFIGGIYSASVTKSFATGDVVNTAGGGVGGFVGLIALGGSVSDVFARGSVTGNETTGGLVGASDAFSGTNNITNGYSTGAVTGDSTEGGLIGFSASTNIVNSYWDTQSSGNAVSPGGGAGFDTQSAKQEVSYNNWNFDTVWFIDEGTNNGYPCLDGVGGICTLDSTAPTTTLPETTTTAAGPGPDDDADGVSDSVEDHAPNNGDGNGDGTPDSQQANVASLPSTTGIGYITVKSPVGTTIVSTSGLSESTSVKDSKFDYKFGLVSFSVSGVTPGATVEMNVYFATNEAPAGFVGRKFIDGTYSTLDGSSLQSVFAGTTRTLKLTYGLKDGGDLDEDGVANGTIIDPVGLGSAAGALPSTGANTGGAVFLALMLILCGVGFTRYRKLLPGLRPSS